VQAHVSRLRTPAAPTDWTYAIVTPVRDDAQGLRRLAQSLEAQSWAPAAWLIVDTGSTDETVPVAKGLARKHDWIAAKRVPGVRDLMRGGPIVRAFHEGLRFVPEDASVVVKVDADTSFDAAHFEMLLTAFAADARLGIASGSCYEQDRTGAWRERHSTGSGVWGAARAYRRTCLKEILPLEERMGWDTVDLIAAELRGWRTRRIDVPFRHHRPEGARDASRFEHWRKQGHVSHYVGYRPSYLMLRALFQARRDPAALAVALGYVEASFRGEPTVGDPRVRDYVREQQAWRRIPAHARQVLARRRVLEVPREPA
jgi:poly-beta-1,6-N-acetyl-D-glucosamine synthase